MSLSLKKTWKSQLRSMVLQAEHQGWWDLAASLYQALSAVRRLTDERFQSSLGLSTRRNEALAQARREQRKKDAVAAYQSQLPEADAANRAAAAIRAQED